jgi:hypothetical protein
MAKKIFLIIGKVIIYWWLVFKFFYLGALTANTISDSRLGVIVFCTILLAGNYYANKFLELTENLS